MIWYNFFLLSDLIFSGCDDHGIFSSSAQIDFSIRRLENMEDFLEHLQTLPQEDHFLFSFRYGEIQLAKRDLDVVIKEISQAPKQEQPNLLDGYGHGYVWENRNIEDNWRNIQKYVPNSNHRDILVRGMLSHHLQIYTTDLSQLNQIILYYESFLPVISIQDGLRIALQKNLTKDEVFSKIHLFDQKYQIPIVEEMGWRTGNDQFQKYLKTTETWNYDPKLFCPFVQGIARGHILEDFHENKISTIFENLRKLGDKHPTCKAHIWHGAGIGFAISDVKLNKTSKSLLQEDELQWISVDPQTLVWSSPN